MTRSSSNGLQRLADTKAGTDGHGNGLHNHTEALRIQGVSRTRAATTRLSHHQRERLVGRPVEMNDPVGGADRFFPVSDDDACDLRRPNGSAQNPTRRRDTPGTQSTINYGRGSRVVMIMIVVMVMVVRISTMNFFQLFKLEVTHGCLQCLSGDANAGLETATSESTQDRSASPQMGAPSRVCCRRRNGRSKTKPERFFYSRVKSRYYRVKSRLSHHNQVKALSGM
jgi:hypothetical protein